MIVLVLWTKPSSLYRQRRGLGLHRVGYREGDLTSELPSLPSTQRRVPSEHGTKSWVLYLHSPTVRLKYIIRLSEDPLIEDSLSSPWTRLQWRWVWRADCLRHCKAGSSSEYSIQDFKHKNRVRLCKINSTYHRREYNIFTNLICWQVS